jgi:RNA polymerase sigma factor (TIGR02999 family)
MPEKNNAPLTQLLQQAAQGEPGALNQVFSVLYPDLRRIAHARLRSQGGVAHLETTALVHESFLHLVEAAELALADRKHFFTYAAKTMRNIIIEFARRASAILIKNALPADRTLLAQTSREFRLDAAAD